VPSPKPKWTIAAVAAAAHAPATNNFTFELIARAPSPPKASACNATLAGIPPSTPPDGSAVGSSASPHAAR
jgi:hypothetical protein